MVNARGSPHLDGLARLLYLDYSLRIYGGKGLLDETFQGVLLRQEVLGSQLGRLPVLADRPGRHAAPQLCHNVGARKQAGL